MDHLQKSFDAFFSGEAKVAVIKGSWGVGKTYFWNSYILARISRKDLNQIAYSYISLFGKTSLADVKQSLFHSAKAISSNSEIDSAFNKEFTSSSDMLNRVPWAKGRLSKALSKIPWLGWFTKNVQFIPTIGKFSNIITSFEYSLVNNYVICFDDLERKGTSLSVREVMGLIDELALRKDCKVVLIFNERSLEQEADKEEFNSYREKVVDIELNHTPSYLDNLKLVFSEDDEHFNVVLETVSELNINNIRVLKKIKWMIDSFDEYFVENNEELREEFLVHAVVLCWGYFIRDKDLPFEELKIQINENSWMSFIVEKEEKRTAGDIRFSAIASNLKLSPSLLDVHIIHYLEHGYINKSELVDVISSLTKGIEVERVKAKLRNAWDIYRGSFSDNLDDFKNSLIKIINENIANLELDDFSSAIGILEEFGDDISSYITKYTEEHKESLISYDSWDMGRVNIPALRDAITDLQSEPKNFNIDDVSEKIAVNNGWSPEDIDFLASLDKNDFYTWMKSNPTKLIKKIRSGLLKFRNVRPSNESDKKKYEKITLNVVGALKDISSENEFNKIRIKNIYEVEV